MNAKTKTLSGWTKEWQSRGAEALKKQQEARVVKLVKTVEGYGSSSDSSKQYMVARDAVCGRMTGKSIRLLDNYIQHFFTFGWVEVIDHENKEPLNEMLAERVVKRLISEHSGYIEFDKIGNCIYMK